MKHLIGWASGATLAALMALGCPAGTASAQTQTGVQCYNGNCTGAGITSKRKCYICCAEKCSENGTQTTGCQEECDKAHPKLVVDRLMENNQSITFPRGVGDTMPITAADQVAFLMDDNAVLWALEKGVVTENTIDFIDWFIVGTEEQPQRWGLVTLSWLVTECPTTPKAREMAREIFFAELEEDPDPAIRRLALGLLAEAQMWYDNPRSTVRIMHAVTNDPAQIVRDHGRNLFLSLSR